MPDFQPKHVLMTGDTVGGVWTFTLELASVLAAHGVEVTLATMGGEPTDAQRAQAKRCGAHLHTSAFKLEWMDDPWDDVAESGRWLLSLAQRHRPDVVHLNTFGHGALPWECPVVLTAHSCVLSWWQAVKRSALPEQWSRYRSEVTRAIQAADVLTAPSHDMLDAIEFHYGPGLPGQRLAIPNGRAAESFPAGAKEPFVLTAGRLWDESKNAAAVAAVAGRLPWTVYLAGDSAPFAGCQMLGRLSSDELAGWFARASIYALPARYEPFGLSILEAALAGCALVLGDIPSLREIWEDAALYVPPEDPARLEEALLHLMSCPQERIRMARRATARAATFTPERMAAGYLEAYRLAAERSVACAS